MGHIFISYSHKDGTYAHMLAESLQNMGMEVWIDARLDYGSQWPLEIQKQLDSCDAFVLLMSPRSFASDWVQSELQRAKRKLKPIFPLLLEGDEPWLSVESTQYYDVRNKDLPDNRFYLTLKRVVPVSQNISTAQVSDAPRKTVPLSNTRSGLNTGIIVASLAGLGIVFLVCLIVVVPILSRLLNSEQNSPSPTIMVVTATQPPDVKIALSATNVPPTSEATQTPTWTPSPIPTSTWTSIPPTFTHVPPTWTPEPITVSRDYAISQCCNSVGQRSGVIDYVLNVNTVGILRIEFVAQMEGSCSDVFLHILWDGSEIYQTNAVGPLSGRSSTGLLDLSSAISKGKHTLTISPEGFVGGCNSGTLGGWAGTLTVQTSKYP